MKTAISLIATLLFAGFAQAADYRVTVTNLTVGQPLTPFLVVTHQAPFSLYQMGETASPGLAEMAIDGGLSILRGEARRQDGFIAAQTISGILPAKQNRTINLSADPQTEISLVSMLARTNDAFVGGKDLSLNLAVGESSESLLKVYDAGAEVNTESCDHVPARPCDSHGVGIEENGVILPHPGLMNIGDLDPVRDAFGTFGAMIKIERVR